MFLIMNELKINNRRYIGSKTKLLSAIYDSVPDEYKSSGKVFADLFAGTGVVSYYFAEKGFKVICNDNLYSNYVTYKAWLSNGPYDENKIASLISYFNGLKYSDINENYFSDVYGNKYYSLNDAKKIGYIRDYLEDHKEELTEREYFILLTSLLYSADKIANTVGHFESYLNKTPTDTNFILRPLDLSLKTDCLLYNMDANALAKQISADVVYIDPPYNGRQYVNFYHVLENLARWNKPSDFEGRSMKFKRNELKSGYSRPIAAQLFEDLIKSLDCSYIVVSYSNSYITQSTASVNKIQESQILDILSIKGKVTKKEISYDAFNAGKTHLKNHKEYIFCCEVHQRRS